MGTLPLVSNACIEYRSFNPPLNPPELEKIATLSTSDSLSETTGDLCSNSSSSFDGALKC